MQKSFKELMLLISLFFAFDGLQAQNDSKDDNSYYFDDSVSESKNIIKVNALAIVNGDLPFLFERVITKSFSIELGVGFLLPYYVPELGQAISSEFDIENPRSGYSLWFHPKFYARKEAPFTAYIGFLLRHRNYNQLNGNTILTDLTVGSGLQFVVGERFALDLDIGLGFGFGKQTIAGNSDDVIEMFVPIGLKFGYVL